MGRFETFDHTADVGLRIHASSLADLMETAALGVVSLVVANPASIESRVQSEITLQADNPTDLLLAWLDEILFRIETTHVVFSRIQLTAEENTTSRWLLNAHLWGEPIDANRHGLDHEVKAVTRHGAFAHCDGSTWIAEVVLDI